MGSFSHAIALFMRPISAGVSAATTLVSFIMNILAAAKKSTTQATLGANWAKAAKTMNQSDVPRKKIRASAVVPAAPLHSIGAEKSAEGMNATTFRKVLTPPPFCLAWVITPETAAGAIRNHFGTTRHPRGAL